MVYKSDPRGVRPVSLIALHTAEGSRTAASLGAYFWRDDVQASSHVGIDAGATLQYVPNDRSAWTLRSGCPISDNAELCAFADFTREQWLGTAEVRGCKNPRAMLDRAAAWVRSRCLARGIPIRKLSPVQVAAGMAGVIGHADWTYGMNDGSHTDPGAGFPWDYVITKANESGGGTAPPVAGMNGEGPTMIFNYEDTYEIAGYEQVTADNGEVTLKPIRELKVKTIPFTLPVGATSAMIARAWVSVKTAGAGAVIDYVRLMSIRNQAQYGMPGGGYPVDRVFEGVDADKERVSIEAADGQDSFTVLIKSAYPFSICVETLSK